jgi:hypothetical protein
MVETYVAFESYHYLRTFYISLFWLFECNAVGDFGEFSICYLLVNLIFAFMPLLGLLHFQVCFFLLGV